MAREADDVAGELIEQVRDDTPGEFEIFDPAGRAHRMRLAGKPWTEVAQTCGYPTTQNAVAAVTAYLQRAALEVAAEDRALALQRELERLDEYTAAFHGLATVGKDLKAAAFLLNVSKFRSELLQLTVAEKIVEKQTIIITGGDDMAAELEKLVLGSGSPAPAGAAPQAPTPE